MAIRRKKPEPVAVEPEKEPKAAAKPKPETKSKPLEVLVVTTPHGDGMRVYGVYSSEKKAEPALEADPRNRVETRVLDGAAE